eukprot:scaffold228568_cov30-Tisochrysis_lutea.AAC.1
MVRAVTRSFAQRSSLPRPKSYNERAEAAIVSFNGLIFPPSHRNRVSFPVSPPMLPCLPSALWALHKCIHFQSPPRSSSAVPCVSGAWSLPATLAPLESFAPTCLDGPTAFALLFRMPSSSRTLCLPPVLQPSFASSHPAVRPSPSSTSLAVHASFRYTLIPPLPPS